MAKGVYIRTRPAWNKGKKGEDSHSYGNKHCLGHSPWNKGKIGVMPSGKNHKRYVERIDRVCEGCGVTFKIEKWRLKDISRGKFCTPKCCFKFRVGKNATRFEGKTYMKSCELCGKEYIYTEYGNKKTCSKECRYKYFSNNYVGKNHWAYKGITPENEKLRKSLQYKQWRKDVFDRDKYTCQLCEITGIYLHANHIKKFSDYPELRFELNNGITLCKECHFKIVTNHEKEWESYFNFNLETRFL